MESREDQSAELVVDVDGGTGHGSAIETRLGRCYVLAGRRAMEKPGSVLVHGTIQGGDNPRTGHAWVELPGGTVWEPITQWELPADAFERLFNAKAERRYAATEICVLSLRYEHWGPWTEEAS